jgi:hypothetical protein
MKHCNEVHLQVFLIFILLLFSSKAINAKAIKNIPWSNTLAYDGGGYWTIRVPISIENKLSEPLKGTRLHIVLSYNDGTSVLIGEPVSTLRIADENGIEFLFELKDQYKQRKRKGLLSEGDIIIFPAVVEVDSTVFIFFYAGNLQAWLPPDIRDFADDLRRSRKALNEWLEISEDALKDIDGINIQVKTAEKRKLAVKKADSSWIPGSNWLYRVPIYVCNFSKRDIQNGTFTGSPRRINNQIGKLLGFDAKPALCLIDPQDPNHPMEISGNFSETICVKFNIPALTEKTFWLYISKNPNVKGQSRFVDLYANMRNNPFLNVRSGQFEAREQQNCPLSAWIVDPLVKVFRWDIVPREPNIDIKVYTARNSYKSFQIVLHSLKDLDINISITSLKNIKGEELPTPDLYKMGYVPVDFPVKYSRISKISDYIRFSPNRIGSDGWADWWPDPLIPIKNNSFCKIEANNTQPIWFDLHIPKDISPGVYTGYVILESSWKKISMPVEIKVWHLVLPKRRHIPAVYDLRRGPGKNPFGDNMPGLKGWSMFLAKYNVSPGVLPQPKFTYKNSKVYMKTEIFDEMAHFLIDELNISMLYTPDFFYSVHRDFKAKPIFNLKPFSPEYMKAWKDAYRIFINHITEKGWRRNFVLYLWDEPRRPPEFISIARLADMAKEVAPDVPIYVSSWYFIKEIAGHITLWGIGAHLQFPVELIKEQRNAGDKFIYTTDGQQCLDTPFPATERLMPWFCFKYGVEAFEFWGSTWWTFNPWKYGWHAFIREGEGKQIGNPIRYPNGDGYIVYPGDEIGISKPVPSLRIIAVREGVDDFEIFNALNKFAERGNPDAQEILDIVRSLVIKPHKSGMLSTSFMPNPSAIVKARNAAGELLDKLGRKLN